MECKTTKTFEEFEKSYQLIKNEGFIDRANRNEKAYYGDLWNVTTENKEKTKSIPKPVFPMCKYKIDTIVSNILSVPVSLRFNCADNEHNTEFVTNFIKSLQKEMHHEKFREIYTRKSAILGTAFCHIIFNDKKFGVLGDYEGALEEEYLKFDNVMLSNPSLDDIQKQKWIIIRSRKSIATLKGICEEEAQRKLIVPDDKETDDPNEINDNDLCTCYLKYFRKDGEVYHTLCTKNAIVYEPTPLNPNLIDVLLKKIDLEKYTTDELLENGINDIYGADGDVESLPDNTLESGIGAKSRKFYMYPIAVLSIFDSANYIYGHPLADDVINANKCINQLYSSCVQSANFNANDIMIVRKGALKGQTITNKAGQILIDHSPTGDGIRRLGNMNVISGGQVQLAENIAAMSRTFGQFNESFTGDDSKDLSGTAIATRQAAAEKPIDTMRKKLWYFEEAIGKILEQYVKFYYKNKKFAYELTESQRLNNKNYNQTNLDAIRKGEISPKSTSTYQTATFNGEDYMETPFYISVEVVQGTKDSDIMLMSVIQSLFLNGSWMNMDIHAKKFFIEMYPLPNKDKFRELIKEDESGYVSQLEQKNSQLEQALAQCQQTMKRAENIIGYLGKYQDSMKKSYTDEVKAHQQDNKTRDDAMAQVLSGAKEPQLNQDTGMVK